MRRDVLRIAKVYFKFFPPTIYSGILSSWKLFDLPQIDATRCHGKEQVIIQKLLWHPKGTVSPEIEGKTYSLFRLRVSFLLSFGVVDLHLVLTFLGEKQQFVYECNSCGCEKIVQRLAIHWRRSLGIDSEENFIIRINGVRHIGKEIGL